MAAACRASAPAAPVALRANGGGYVLHMVVPDEGAVALYGLRTFTVLRPVTLEEVRPAVVPSGVEVLAARVSYLATHGTRTVANGYPGGICTDRWPPAGFGPSYPVARLDLYPGDVVALSLFLRATRPGRYRVDGFDVAYDDGGKRRNTREEADHTVELTVLRPGERSERRVCVPTRDSAWLR